MNVLVSKCNGSDMKFSKGLFIEVADNLKVMKAEELEACEEPYKKVSFAAYLRTDKDNLVLLIDKDKIANLFNVPSYALNGGLMHSTFAVDVGYLSGKTLCESAFSFKSSQARDRFASNSTCFPIGAVETTKSLVLVYNVVVSVDLLRDAEIVLNSGFHFHPIETLTLSDSLQREISESLVIVKSEDNADE